MLSYFHILLLLKGAIMRQKNICYFRQNESTNETVHILDCGYHETTQGQPSAQTVIDHYVLHCIVKGKGTYQVHNQTWHLSAGDCFLLIPNVPIRYQSDACEPWVYYWIGFYGIDALQIIHLCNIRRHAPVLHYNPIEELTSMIQPLIFLNSASTSDCYTALSQFYGICAKLIQHNQNIKPLSRKEYYVAQAISLIQDSYYTDITVQSVSDTIGLDRTYLYRIFKEISGIPIQQYIANLRLKRACSFLADTTLSFSEIAYYCGYTSEQYFSMAFKKSTGFSPSAYRKKHLATKE